MVNVGSTDRALRFSFGIALVVVPFVPAAADLVAGWGLWKYALTIWGVAMLGTAVFRFCPAYFLFGIRTCEFAKR